MQVFNLTHGLVRVEGPGCPLVIPPRSLFAEDGTRKVFKFVDRHEAKERFVLNGLPEEVQGHFNYNTTLPTVRPNAGDMIMIEVFFDSLVKGWSAERLKGLMANVSCIEIQTLVGELPPPVMDDWVTKLIITSRVEDKVIATG